MDMEKIYFIILFFPRSTNSLLSCVYVCFFLTRRKSLMIVVFLFEALRNYVLSLSMEYGRDAINGLSETEMCALNFLGFS